MGTVFISDNKNSQRGELMKAKSDNLVQLGIDIGGTNIKFGVLEDEKLVYTDIVKTSKEADCIIEDIVKKYKEIKKKYNISKIGIGTPGSIVDGLVSASNLPFSKYPLQNELFEKVGLPIKIDNDANCAALGEIKFGSASDCDNVVLITIGTGIGGGIIMNRTVVRGKGRFGEIGHMIIQADNGLPCKCGLFGCWEQYVSVTALVREAEKAALENQDSILYSIYTDNKNSLDGEKIFEALNKNCYTAMLVYDKYISYMALGLQSINKIFCPDAIILAGGITMQGERLLKSIKSKLISDIRIEISELQSKAGVMGAAIL